MGAPGTTSSVNHCIRKCRHNEKWGWEKRKQLTSALPPERVQPYSYAIACVKADCVGPVVLVQCQRPEKRWPSVNMCASLLVVPLEAAGSLSSCASMQALRSFLNSYDDMDDGMAYVGSSENSNRSLADLHQLTRATLKQDSIWEIRKPSALHEEAQIMMNNKTWSEGVRPEDHSFITPTLLLTSKPDYNKVLESASPGNEYQKGYGLIRKINGDDRGMLFNTKTPEYPVGIIADVEIDQDGRIRTVFVTMLRMRAIRRNALIEAADGQNEPP